MCLIYVPGEGGSWQLFSSSSVFFFYTSLQISKLSNFQTQISPSSFLLDLLYRKIWTQLFKLFNLNENDLDLELPRFALQYLVKHFYAVFFFKPALDWITLFQIHFYNFQDHQIWSPQCSLQAIGSTGRAEIPAPKKQHNTINKHFPFYF